MTYDIMVQDKLYRTFTSTNGYQFQEVAKEVSAAIADGSLIIDPTKDVGIVVKTR